MEVKKPRVILIDDTIDFRVLFEYALRPKQVELTLYSSARSALGFLNETEDPPDLIFADLKMPDMAGDEFVRTLRSSSKLKDSRVVLCSASADIATISKSVGASGCLKKPFELGDLYRLIDRLAPSPAS